MTCLAKNFKNLLCIFFKVHFVIRFFSLCTLGWLSLSYIHMYIFKITFDDQKRKEKINERGNKICVRERSRRMVFTWWRDMKCDPSVCNTAQFWSVPFTIWSSSPVKPIGSNLFPSNRGSSALYGDELTRKMSRSVRHTFGWHQGKC